MSKKKGTGGAILKHYLLALLTVFYFFCPFSVESDVPDSPVILSSDPAYREYSEISPEGRDKTWHIDSDNNFIPEMVWKTYNEKLTGISGSVEPAEYSDIKWQPKAFLFKHGDSIRYIDFKNGDDQNSGTSKENPWKHHPWDENAEGMAAKCKGIHTYCFKQGVVYRGRLTAQESGVSDNPVILTRDPSWGNGKAGIYGSVRITQGWEKCTDGQCPEIPSEGRDKIWYIDTDNTFIPRMVWEIYDEKATRIPIARTPNWKITDPDDPRSQWWELTGAVFEIRIYLESTKGFKTGDEVFGSDKYKNNIFRLKKVLSQNAANRITMVKKDFILIDSFDWKAAGIKQGSKITNGKINAKVIKIDGTHKIISRLYDKKHFTQTDPAYWVGATMWAEKGYMPKPDAEKIISFNPEDHSVKIKYHRGMNSPVKYCRYYLENLLKFLDHPGEYYFKERGESAGRLFIRLPEDRNPNFSALELAKENVLIDIHNKSNITISGLDLKYSNNIDVGIAASRHALLYTAAVRLKGSCSHIKVINSNISHVTAGVAAHPEKKKDVFDYIEVSDNDFNDIDSAAIAISNGRSHYCLKDSGSRLIHVSVQNNRAINTGYRVLSHWGIGPHTIHLEGCELADIAGNIVKQCWGSGIMAFNGSDYSRGNVERPLIRVLIHNNLVKDSLLGMQDYGGIESWMAGPSYVYNNISINPVGYKHSDFKKLAKKNWYRTSCFGVGIYFDGQYKGYAFNNLMAGKNNNVNDRIYNSCAFSEAMGFLNTIFNNTMYNFGVGFHKGMFQHNRCSYLGNVLIDMGLNNIQHDVNMVEIEYPTLAYKDNIFVGNPQYFGELGKNKIKSLNVWQDLLKKEKAVELQTGKMQELVYDSAASGYTFQSEKVRAFVPWGLYSVVGEWNFLHSATSPETIIGENINFNKEWIKREMYQYIPRNNLIGVNINENNYCAGLLENWTKGALWLNGLNQYCRILDADLKKGYEWQYENGCKVGSFDGKDRQTLGMDTNNFLIECVLKTDQKNKGVIAGKFQKKGYTFYIDDGYLIMALKFGKNICYRVSNIVINDKMWHHVISEVDRSDPEGINIYIDGKKADGKWFGTMDNLSSIENESDFTVGKSSDENFNYYKGFIDYLRVSRGTLNDAETNIEELYKWEFHGPFLQ